MENARSVGMTTTKGRRVDLRCGKGMEEMEIEGEGSGGEGTEDVSVL